MIFTAIFFFYLLFSYHHYSYYCFKFKMKIKKYFFPWKRHSPVSVFAVTVALWESRILLTATHAALSSSADRRWWWCRRSKCFASPQLLDKNKQHTKTTNNSRLDDDDDEVDDEIALNGCHCNPRSCHILLCDGTFYFLIIRKKKTKHTQQRSTAVTIKNT